MRASLGARFSMIVRTPAFSAFAIDDAQGHDAERHHALFERPAAIRLLGVTGKGARGTYAKGWTPSSNQKPWQDRRMLTQQRAQPPTILRMVFCFCGVSSFANS
jgi:hypothetical protein